MAILTPELLTAIDPNIMLPGTKFLREKGSNTIFVGEFRSPEKGVSHHHRDLAYEAGYIDTDALLKAISKKEKPIQGDAGRLYIDDNGNLYIHGSSDQLKLPSGQEERTTTVAIITEMFAPFAIAVINLVD